jgi:hypothetical protein
MILIGLNVNAVIMLGTFVAAVRYTSFNKP